MENFSLGQEYLNLTDEQNKILGELKDFFATINSDLKIRTKVQEKIVDFGNELDSQGFDLGKYVLWHKLIGSTPFDSADEFDTQDRKVEAFIKSLKE